MNSMSQSLPEVHRLFEKIDRPLWLVTSAADQVYGGLIATFVFNASLIPAVPRPILAIAKQHHTWKVIEQSGRVALHLLAPDNLDLVWRFGLASGTTVDRFAGLTFVRGEFGCPLLPQTLCGFECEVVTSLDIGDRTIFAARVASASFYREGDPLTTNQLRELADPARAEELERQRSADIGIDFQSLLHWKSPTNKSWFGE
jgi:flavin reductase (DIM6/NTAB) family NADH-FMN oxidoreductase RutF